MRIAWFSPMPPSRSGIAAYSAELVPRLRERGVDIDVFSEDVAHHFVWNQRRNPYALAVFQLGNAAVHDYMWGYLFRYPGLVVLHDAQLHQARALHLTRRWKPRRLAYLDELRANHPDAPPDLGELVAAGLGGLLYHHWPMVRLVIGSARLTVVHNRRLGDALRERYPDARIADLEMGVDDPQAALERHGASDGQGAADLRADIRRRHDIPPDAVVVAAYGGLTPEKRIPQIIRATSELAQRYPRLHVLLVGAPVAHYDAGEDARRWDVQDRVHVTGFVPDEELPAYLLAADIGVCLRWPTNRETSASWLRCLAAGQPTIITDLAQLGDVPSLDPRGWRLLDTQGRLTADGDPVPGREPVAVSIDLLDEDHSLQLALTRLVDDAALRTQLGRAARAWWESHHRIDAMAAAYVPLIEEAAATPAPDITLPAHLRDDGTAKMQALAEAMGVSEQVRELRDQTRSAAASA